MKRHLNLLPWECQRRTLLRQRLRNWSFAWGLIGVLCAALYSSEWVRLSRSRHELGESQRRAAGIQAIEQQNGKLKQEVTRLQGDIDKFGHLKNERIGIHLLGAVSQSWNVCGGKIQVRKMALREIYVADTVSPDKAGKPAPANPAKPPPTRKVQTLSLSGVAAHNLAVSQFVAALRDTGAFVRVDLKSSKGNDDRQVNSHAYQVECVF